MDSIDHCTDPPHLPTLDICSRLLDRYSWTLCVDLEYLSLFHTWVGVGTFYMNYIKIICVDKMPHLDVTSCFQ